MIQVSGDSCIFVWRLPLNLSRAMRKRCSIIADSRPPLKTLKSSVPRSNINEVPRAAKMPRVHQLKGGFMDDTSALSESVATDENVCLTKHGENAAEIAGRDCQNADASCTETEGTEVWAALKILGLVQSLSPKCSKILWWFLPSSGTSTIVLDGFLIIIIGLVEHVMKCAIACFWIFHKITNLFKTDMELFHQKCNIFWYS